MIDIQFDKQKMLIENLVSSNNLFAICGSILKSSYFEIELQKTVSFLIEYVDTHRVLPTPVVIKAETGVDLELRDIPKDVFDYSATEIEKFCKIKSVIASVEEVVDSIQKNELDGIVDTMQEALAISLKRDLGVDYFLDPKTRLMRLASDQAFQSTGLDELDKMLGGGLIEGQLIVFTGNSGTGKSITLSNISLNLMEDGLDVLYVTLELSEDLVFLRYNGLMAGHKQTEWQDHIDDTVQVIKSSEASHGKLFIKYMDAESNAQQVRAYLKEFQMQYGFLPKTLVLDYLDIAGSNSGIGGDNVFLKDKEVSEQFRNLGNEFGMYVLSAAQQNRSAVNVIETDHSHISGGISKINTADYVFSISLTDSMKAAGVIGYRCLKSRSSDGVGHSGLFDWDNDSLRIKNLNDSKKRDMFDANADNDGRENVTKDVARDILNDIEKNRKSMNKLVTDTAINGTTNLSGIKKLITITDD